MASDAITHSYKNHKRKKWLTEQIETDVNEIFNAGSTIGGYTVFPGNRIDRKHTINQARGVHSLIDDRFDITLECIRLYYLGMDSPLYDTLLRYKSFFSLFEDFKGYVQFFLLDDLVDDNHYVRFYLPFDDFNSRPIFSTVNDYLTYKTGVINFIKARNSRIKNYVEHDKEKLKVSP